MKCGFILIDLIHSQGREIVTKLREGLRARRFPHVVRRKGAPMRGKGEALVIIAN